MSSKLPEYAGPIDPGWLRAPLSVDEFFARDVRQAIMRRRPEKRVELEEALAADRAIIEAAMQPGDELRPWVHLFDGTGPSGNMGVAVVRGSTVVKAWWTAFTC